MSLGQQYNDVAMVYYEDTTPPAPAPEIPRFNGTLDLLIIGEKWTINANNVNQRVQFRGLDLVNVVVPDINEFTWHRFGDIMMLAFRPEPTDPHQTVNVVNQFHQSSWFTMAAGETVIIQVIPDLSDLIFDRWIGV